MVLDPHLPLREDVRLLGELLGQVLREHEGELVFESVERVRETAKAARRSGDAHFEEVAELLRHMSIESALTVARAFAHFLHLANIAEQHHRVRRRRDHARDPQGRAQRGSCAETFQRLKDAGVPGDALAHAIESLRVELVFTAHPTEIARRTLIQKHNRIAALLALRDRPDLTPEEREESQDELHRVIAAAWQTDEVRRQQVTPLDEVRAGLVVFEQSLWDALPQYLRAVDRALHDTTGHRLRLDVAPVLFGSWIGGDRDGNPNITPEVTRQATWLARWQAADLYLREIVALRSELSLTNASDELRARVGNVQEPYRALLAEVRDRLAATRAWAEASLASAVKAPTHPSASTAPYMTAADFAEPLRLCLRSLEATGNSVIASGRLTDMLRRVATFGVTLARLDVRQEADRHRDAVEWVARTSALGSYADLAEDARQRWLLQQLTLNRIRLSNLPVSNTDADVRDVLDTFLMAAAVHPESLGAYVITMASEPSDVLAVEFLQMIAGTRDPQRVVPLFETGRDLEHAGRVIAALLDIDWYRERLGGQLEVMIGYSDSAKDEGRFSANWSLYRAQEEIVAACERRNVHLTLFHGRGGSVGRGGGPTYLAIQSQPPGSIRGTLRATEQGEMIQAKFGLGDIAIRTLEVYTTATLEATLTPQAPPAAEWRTCMDELASRARKTYRSIVYDDPRFIPYFRAATPERELGVINIGSRPPRRAKGGGVESLRAIPWQFAWTQTRLLLASWLGVEDALMTDGIAMQRTMYARWPFFTSTIDLMEMTLAKADERIAAQYDRLVPIDLRPIGTDLRSRLNRAVHAVLAATEHGALLETNPVLRRSIDVRNPYVDPINLVQVELLRRLRSQNAEPELFDAFVVTVNGIAAGMRNTG